MFQRLSWKLAAVVTVGIALLHLTYGYFRVEREGTQFEAEARRDHLAMAHALSVAATSTLARAGTEEAVRLLEDADLETDHADIRWVSDEEGPTLIESIVSRPNGIRTLTSRVALPLGGSRGVLEIREPLVAEDAYVRDTISRTVVVTLVLLVLCAAILFGASWLLIQRPMRALLDKVERIGQGDLSGPLSLPQRDELGTLGHAIDMMCQRLEDLQSRNERESRAKLTALEQLRHADRLGTVGVLAAGLAHELGTPLNVVAARAKMIVRHQSEGEDAVSDAGIIVEQTERMTAIIRQLLDFARRRKPHRAVHSLTELCGRTLEILETLARKSDVRLELAEGEDVRAFVDAGQLEQVVTNLVVNAIQAQPDGGVVRVSVSSGSIVVEDEGEGMTDSVREHLFEPFFTTKEVGRGTGLGLSVAYGIVREHGGQISVEEAPGGGSRFTVELPA